MSEQEDAQGRTLRYDYAPGYCGELVTNTGWSICTFTDEPSKTNAERLVACWNACDGIDTEDLNAGSVSIIHKLHDEAAQRVLAQRDELLAALQGILGYFDSGNSVPVSQATIRAGSDEVKAARAAIAKVEGGA